MEDYVSIDELDTTNSINDNDKLIINQEDKTNKINVKQLDDKITQVFTGIIWENYEYLADAAGTQSDKYKGTSEYDIASFVNIQFYDNRKGIYITFPSAVISCSIDAMIQGAGIWAYLENFTRRETVFTVNCVNGTYKIAVYFEDGYIENCRFTSQDEHKKHEQRLNTLDQNYETEATERAEKDTDLQTQIDNIENGTTAAAKANSDGSGNNIEETYVKKEESDSGATTSITNTGNEVQIKKRTSYTDHFFEIAEDCKIEREDRSRSATEKEQLMFKNGEIVLQYSKDSVIEGPKEVTLKIKGAGVQITGDFEVSGNITQQGEAYETHAEKLYTAKDLILTRDGATAGLSENEYTGIQAKKYDGENDGQLVFDSEGIARVGDIGDTQPLATREEEPVDGALAKWDAATKKFVTIPGKTINNQSILGEGNIEVQEVLESGVNIKKINGQDLLGDGEILVGAGVPQDHSSEDTTYGAGTSEKYGHNKVIDNLDNATYNDGLALSAHQGYVLNQNKASKVEAVTEGTRSYFNTEGSNYIDTNTWGYFIVDPDKTSGNNLYLVTRYSTFQTRSPNRIVCNKQVTLPKGTLKVFVNGIDVDFTVTTLAEKTLKAHCLYSAVFDGEFEKSESSLSFVYNFEVALPNYSLIAGSRIRITFQHACLSYDNYTSTGSYYPTLNVNGTGAKRIYINNCGKLEALTPKKFYGVAYYWQPYTTLELMYTGSYWLIVNNTDLFSYRGSIGNFPDVCCNVNSNGVIEQRGENTETSLKLPIPYKSLNEYQVMSAPINDRSSARQDREHYRKSTVDTLIKTSAYLTAWRTIGV